MSSAEQTWVQRDPFRHTLQRYIAEAREAFVDYGATTDGPWSPPLTFPGVVSCRGGGPADNLFIESVLFTSKDRSQADEKFAETVAHVEAIVPDWKKSDISQFDMSRMFFGDGPTMSETKVSIDIAIVQLGDDYNVNLVVQSWNAAP